MSLKNTSPELPLKQTKEYLDAVEDLKSGKRNAKRKLYKLVKNDVISIQDYEELLEKHRQKKKEVYLFGYPIKDYIPILFIFSIVAAVMILRDAIDEGNFWEFASFVYLGISFSLYYYLNVSDKEDKNAEIAMLKQEIKRLESFSDSDKNIIELQKKEIEILEKELKKAKDVH